MHDHLIKYRELYTNSSFCTVCANRIRKNNKKKFLKCCKQEVCSYCITKYNECPYCKKCIYDLVSKNKNKVIEIYDEKKKETIYLYQKDLTDINVENDSIIEFID